MNETLNIPGLQSPTHLQNTQFFKSPCRISGVVLGLIIIIGSVIAQGVTYSSLGPNSHLILAGIPIGIALITGSIFYPKISSCLASVKDYLTSDMEPPSIRACSSLNGNTLTIGSVNSHLPEEMIESELSKYRKSKGIENLIIYGRSNLELTRDLGFVKMNPKKMILVGACITRRYDGVSLMKLDDTLANKDEWLSQPFVPKSTGPTNGEDSDFTRIIQIPVSSIEDAVQDKQEKHAVYVVQQTIGAI